MPAHASSIIPASELSVIVPVVNEADHLFSLFAMLGRQKEVVFELVLVDGGSTDNTVATAVKLAEQAPFPCRTIFAVKGRGRQMNAGARIAAGENLLFLHGDSVLPDPLALRQGLDEITRCIARRRDQMVAGRFGLRFDVPHGSYGFGYYFYECKARLGRPEGIHGDQGFLLPRIFFEKIGPFEEELGLLEDTRFAEAVRRRGEWLLLPGEISTSARRFESEGLFERQILNAMILTFGAIEWNSFLQTVPGLYRIQDSTRKLDLRSFWKAIKKRLQPLSWSEYLRLWYLTGCYVRPQVWQFAFARDAWRNYQRGLAPGEGGTPSLTFFDRWYEGATDHPPGRATAAFLVWCWFQVMSVYLALAGRRPEKMATGGRGESRL